MMTDLCCMDAAREENELISFLQMPYRINDFAGLRMRLSDLITLSLLCAGLANASSVPRPADPPGPPGEPRGPPDDDTGPPDGRPPGEPRGPADDDTGRGVPAPGGPASGGPAPSVDLETISPSDDNAYR